MPAKGRYWAAAGLRLTAFQMIATNLALVMQFGNGSFLIGLFGVATCDAPSLVYLIKFAYVELGIVWTFDSNGGIFKLEAQLSPRSFSLAPQCHLTGGVALFAWSKGDYSDPDPNQRVERGSESIPSAGTIERFTRHMLILALHVSESAYLCMLV